MNALPLAAGPAATGRIVRLAGETWELISGDDAFPRDPEPRLSIPLKLAVHDLVNLSSGGAIAWAARLGFPAGAIEVAGDRPLRGCLLADRGRAFILVDPADPADERRMTVAHELGHFIIEVRQPRREVQRAAGDDVLAVLDGERPASFDERLAGVLAGASLRPHAHLLSREADGRISCPQIAGAECAADAFAFELLAPRAALHHAVITLTPLPLSQRLATVTALLEARFGLPAVESVRYGRLLVTEFTGGERGRTLLGF